MQIRWRLRMAAAQREVWTAAQLRRLLAERSGLHLSSASVSALFAKQPAQVKLETLVALCTALECRRCQVVCVNTSKEVMTQDGRRDEEGAGEGAGTRSGRSAAGPGLSGSSDVQRRRGRSAADRGGRVFAGAGEAGLGG